MSLLCRIGLHSWDYYGSAHTHAPRPIRCERCRKKYGAKKYKGGVIPPFTYAHSLKLHGAEGVFEQDGRLIYWKEIEIE